MWNWIQGRLTAKGRSFIPANPCRNRMGCLMTSGGKDKDEIPEEPHHHEIWFQVHPILEKDHREYRRTALPLASPPFNPIANAAKGRYNGPVINPGRTQLWKQIPRSVSVYTGSSFVFHSLGCMPVLQVKKTTLILKELQPHQGMRVQ